MAKRNRCRIKQREYARRWREKNKGWGAEWRRRNKDIATKSTIAWQKRNPDKVREARARYRNKNRSKLRGYTLRKYGLTHESFDALLAQQQHKCAACGDSLKELTQKKIHIDHCHDTDMVRGILCLNCNTALGLMQDSLERVKMLAVYIAKFSPSPTPLLSSPFGREEE